MDHQHQHSTHPSSDDDTDSDESDADGTEHSRLLHRERDTHKRIQQHHPLHTVRCPANTHVHVSTFQRM